MAPTSKHICEKCSKNINLRTQKHIFCEGVCRKVWHVPRCSSVSEVEYEEFLKNSEITWFCDPCKNQRRQRRSIMSEVVSTPNQTVQVKQKASASASATASGSPTPPEPESISLKSILSEIKSLQKQQLNNSATLTDLKTIITDYKTMMDNIIQENIELRNEITILHSKLNNVDHMLDTKDQTGLDHNLIINGATEVKDEEIPKIIVKIANALNVSLETNEIENATRKATASEESGLPRSIIVQFKSKSKRDEILQNKKHNITTHCLELAEKNDTPHRPIYISEHLTPRKQFIFKIARDIKRAQIIKFAWAKNGDIFIRESERSKIIKIKHIQQLKNLQNDHTNTTPSE